MSGLDDLEAAVRASLESLADELKAGEWRGRREREVVSLFCLGHLIRRCRPGSALFDPAQISIEVAVPQIDGQRELTGRSHSKSQVCKDIVIWARPRMVAWDGEGVASVPPMSVIEWKHNESRVSEYDMSWLREFSALHSDFVGYAVCTNNPARSFTLSCTRIANGRAYERWLHIN